MFAAAWHSDGEPVDFAGRIAASLVSGLGRSVGQFASGPFAAAAVLPFNDERRARAWRPVVVRDRIVMLAGFIDNLDDLADALGLNLAAFPDPAPALYAEAVGRWGEDADNHVVGHYASLIFEREAGMLRLARSPYMAPPIHYTVAGPRVVVSTVPRVLFAVTQSPRLERDHLADLASFNYFGSRRDWFEGVSRVELGMQVWLGRDAERKRLFYDIRDLPPVRLSKPQDYVDQASGLLAEATRAALRGWRKPGILLSGGLDSSQVAIKALNALGDGARLPAYTFTVSRHWDGTAPGGMFGDERPFVEAFARMHPGLATHFCDNDDIDFDHQLDALFHAIGIAPVNVTNFSVYHNLYRAARADGCDMLLWSDMGNDTFSRNGQRGFVEYLLTGRWGQLHKALGNIPDDLRPGWRKLVGYSLAPLLPQRFMAWQRALRGRHDFRVLSSPLRPEFARDSGATERLNGMLRVVPRNRADDLALMQADRFGAMSEVLQGFDQIYGIAHRDPTAYRPLAEFCLGCPTDVFLHDGEQRWLARSMAKGLMPENQRTNPRESRHHADWHYRIGRIRPRLMAELDRLADDPQFNAMFDVERLRAALEDWPEQTPTDDAERMVREVAVTRATMLTRYIRWVEGRN